MKVHIVALADGWVLGTLAQVLADGTGWSMSAEPDPTADVNYFLPYLLYQRCDTLTAAWFTHYDPNRDGKASRWEHVAKRVSLALTSAPMYLDRLPPRSRLVTPPIDPQFQLPIKPANNGAVTVGIAGQTYDDGRKGEDLLALLVKSNLPVQWKAAGKGWSIPATYYNLKDLHKFYHSINLLVCPSRIEGVPMPPLEALACGVPVVIPRGVGLLDELPDIQGIYRFDAGDYNSLYVAMQDAVMDLMSEDWTLDTQALRAVSEPYTTEAWVQTHIDAMEALLQPRPIPVDKKSASKRNNRGVYYVAFGKQARECAITAITSWKQHMPRIPVALVSDEPLGIEDIFIHQTDTDIGGRRAKLMVNELAPADWDYVLYLDADTEVIADVSLFFQLLEDGWEFVICRDPDKYATTRNMRRPDNGEEVDETYLVMGTEDATQWNGGVFAFRRGERTTGFFRCWLQEWNRWGKRDQAALLRAMWRNPLRVYTLGSEWNTITRYLSPETSAGILHHPMTARRWHGIIHERLDSPEAFRRVIE